MSSEKEGRYYVEYLGWKEARGLFGREFTEPVVRELLARRRHSDELPRMTIKLDRREIQISQHGSKRAEKVKYPPIPVKDATFAAQALYPDTDVIACIFLGYNPFTKCAVHVHVYRFDSENTAALFIRHLTSIIDDPLLKKRVFGIEQDLHELGHITLSRGEQKDRRQSGSDGVSNGTPSPPQSSESMSPTYPTMEEALRQRRDIIITKAPQKELEPKITRIFNNLHEELEYKLSLEDAPILLPPKDYDTIVRRHGHLEIRNEIKASERSVVGPNGIFSQSEHVMPAKSRKEHHRSSSSSTLEPNVPEGEVANGKQGHLAGSHSSNALHRSASDTQANRLPPPQMNRTPSYNSSDQGSNNSDDYFADGLYNGFRPHARSRSRDDDYNLPQDMMAMYSPTFSFGQSGMRALEPHYEEDHDLLVRTAPSGSLPRKEMSREHKHHHKHDGMHVKRSHSHRHQEDVRKLNH